MSDTESGKEPYEKPTGSKLDDKDLEHVSGGEGSDDENRLECLGVGAAAIGTCTAGGAAATSCRTGGAASTGCKPAGGAVATNCHAGGTD
ncbi:hypothetical protein [Methanospirillum hungatei]|uniref:hypothetical protein n=1 Tax=Methanospirillum hungatei TaxID=2203 RepID=UPI0026E96036|nr:hypothetical protein [Methanospirillum hungatei]MCA1916243.1 hypothetical protein [Methanospirillum hungatei]